ncbi:MAG: FHA domain-containing protein [Gammaproteobacteria bacterium]|nr:FHA domain-containing protein [Gammaproteobacteria bacterium]
MPACLTVFFANSPARRFYLDEHGDYLIGRGDGCDVRLDDRRLSRRHAALQCRADGCTLEDLDSKNGIQVDGQRIRRAGICSGTWISFGGLVASFDVVSTAVQRAEERSAAARWENSVELSRQLDPAEGLERVLLRLLESVLTLSGADRGFVLLLRPEGEMRVMRRREPGGSALSEADFTGSRGALDVAMRKLSAVVTCDASEDVLLADRPSIAAESIRALVCLPLAIGDKLLGAIYVDSDMPGKIFSELDLEVLGALANHAALVIGVSSLRDDIAGLALLLPADLQQTAAGRPELVALLREHLPGTASRSADTRADNSADGGQRGRT